MPCDGRLARSHLAGYCRQTSSLRNTDESAHPFERDICSIHFLAISYPLPTHTGSLLGHLLFRLFSNPIGWKPMKILLVFAHPEPQSLAASLRDVAIRELEAAGHEVKVSDLYAMRWRSEVD